MNRENKVIIKEASKTNFPQGIPEGQITYSEVEKKVEQLLPKYNTALRLVLAVAHSAQDKNGLMLWLLLVGVPASGKTDLVRLIKDSKKVFSIDNLTLNAFISGERPTEKEQVHDLLPQLDGKCLVIKDWTAIFSLDEKMTKKLLGDLVGIYDKEFSKFSSRRGQISYNSVFSQLGCITPATLNKHSGYMNMVGPRYLLYIIPDTNALEEEESFENIFSETDRNELELDVRRTVSAYLDQLKDQSIDQIKPLSQDAQNYLKISSRIVSCCRGIAIPQQAKFINDEGKEVQYYEVPEVQIEKPYRAVQQLIKLSKYLTLVGGKNEVGIEELEIIKEVVLSSMPSERAQALKVIKDHSGEVTVKELTQLSEKSNRTSQRLLVELTALDILDKSESSGTIARSYSLSDKYRDFILLDTAEFLSHKEPDEQLKLITPVTQGNENISDKELVEIAEEIFGAKAEEIDNA